jgi:hypothetical protein
MSMPWPAPGTAQSPSSKGDNSFKVVAKFCDPLHATILSLMCEDHLCH